MAIFFASLFGLAVGSFLNVVILRLEQRRGFVFGRSSCPSCGREIEARDLIPVLSFLALRGKCRSCGSPISLQYPLVEGVSALLFAFAVFGASSLAELAFLWTAASLLLVIFVFDLRNMLIPDSVLLLLLGVSFLWKVGEAASGGWSVLASSGVAAAAASGGFLAVYLASRGAWMGFGDVKLAFVMGVILGWPLVLAALFLSFLLGGIAGGALILFGKKRMGSEVPFAPFLVLSTVIAYQWGGALLSWYAGLLWAA